MTRVLPRPQHWKCNVDGCTNESVARKLCATHYSRLRNRGTTELNPNRRHCSVEGCGRTHYGKTFCEKHYKRARAHGSPDITFHVAYKGSHGKSKSLAYRRWSAMRARCHSLHPRYGGRGIKVCDEWDSFVTFYQDMGDPPKGMSLNRIDNDGNYCKENCQWATDKQQARNRSDNILIEYEGRRMTIPEWSERFNIDPLLLRNRIRRGWNVGRALNAPKTTAQIQILSSQLAL